LGQGFLWSRPHPPAELEKSFDRLWPALVQPPRADGSPVRVVLADDRAELRATVRLALELNGGFEVVAEAGTGAEAITLARQHQPDLVLLDVLMPGMTGLEALPQISVAAPNAQVVILTAVDTAILRPQECADAAAMFDKAIGPGRLVEELIELVDRRKARV
jgi:DNA-binding NarL/FixJ family response regulator